MTKEKRDIKTGILYRIYYAVFKTMSLLPLRVLYGVAGFLSWVLRDVVRYRRDVVRENLRNAFPEMSEQERRDVECRFYRHFCDTVVETVKLLHMSEREVNRRIEVVDYELVNRSNREGRSVVLFLGHYGNWEWVMRISDYFDTPGVALGHIYKPLHDKAFDRLMKRVRSRFATRGVPMEQAYRHHLAIHAEGRQYVTGFISDQRPTDAPAHFSTTFLNQETRYTPGAERIGTRTAADFFYVEVEQKSRGHYRLTFLPLHPLHPKTNPAADESGEPVSRELANSDSALSGSAPIESASNERTDQKKGQEENPYTCEYFRKLERTIRRDPALWLWSHRRWLKG